MYIICFPTFCNATPSVTVLESHCYATFRCILGPSLLSQIDDEDYVTCPQVLRRPKMHFEDLMKTVFNDQIVKG